MEKTQGPAPRDEPREEATAEVERVVPELPDPPERYEQDTQPVEGEDAIHPPPGTELIQRSRVQG